MSQETAAGLLQRARELDVAGRDEEALAAYVEVLREDPAHLDALNGFGNLAFAMGRRSAARTVYERAAHSHPGNARVRVNLGNLYYYEDDLAAARLQYEAALALDAGLPEAHQGLARTLDALGETKAAETHWKPGFAAEPIVMQRYRGTVNPVRVLLLVSVKLGNAGTRQFLDDRTFELAVAHVEFVGPDTRLPDHNVVFNAVSDADLCGIALARAESVIARTAAPVINLPARVRRTGRAGNASELAALPGVVTPRVREVARASVPESADSFPLLLRSVGFHTGRHFVRVERREDLGSALTSLPGEQILLIEPLDARGVDSMHRKYRVMIIDGVLCPLHLAISHNWKVHYFNAAMAENSAYREEERRFLEDMPAALGPRAMAALQAIATHLGLDYGGIDFALDRDGSVLLFEANATMSILPPGPDPRWDYRRGAIKRALEAARQMVMRRAGTRSFAP